MKKSLIRIVVLAVAVILAFGQTACSKDDIVSPEKKFALKFNQQSIYITQGDVVEADLELKGIDKADIVWTTSADAVATVAGGTITAVSAGRAEITATAGEYSDTMVVNVAVRKDSVYTLSLNLTQTTLTPGAVTTLNSVVKKDGAAVSDTVQWSKDSESVNITADGNSLIVTAQSVGKARITASIGLVTAVCTVTVVKPSAAKLASPVVTENDGVFSWQAVPNAAAYKIVGDNYTGINVTQTETNFTPVIAYAGQYIYSLYFSSVADISGDFLDSDAAVISDIEGIGQGTVARPILSISGGKLIWTETIGAGGYEVYASETKLATLSSSVREYDLGGLKDAIKNNTLPQNFEFRVSAVMDNDLIESIPLAYSTVSVDYTSHVLNWLEFDGVTYSVELDGRKTTISNGDSLSGKTYTTLAVYGNDGTEFLLGSVKSSRLLSDGANVGDFTNIGWDGKANGTTVTTVKDGNNDVIQISVAGKTYQYVKFGLKTAVDLTQATELSYKLRLASTETGKESSGFPYIVNIPDGNSNMRTLAQGGNGTHFTVDGVANLTTGLTMADGWATITLKNVNDRVDNENAQTNKHPTIVKNSDGTYTVYFMLYARLGGTTGDFASDFVLQMDDIRVVAKEDVFGISLNKESDSIKLGESVNLTASIIKNGAASTDTVQWRVTSGSAALTISGNSVIVTPDEVGTVTVTASIGNASKSCTITVSQADAPRLATPAVTVTGTTLSWAEVAGAVSYRIVGSGNSGINVVQQGTTFNPVVMGEGEFSFTLSITALANDSGEYSDSDAYVTTVITLQGSVAPEITRAGQTLTWSATAGAQSYEVFADTVKVATVTDIGQREYLLSGLSGFLKSGLLSGSLSFTVKAYVGGQVITSAELKYSTVEINYTNHTISWLELNGFEYRVELDGQEFAVINGGSLADEDYIRATVYAVDTTDETEFLLGSVLSSRVLSDGRNIADFTDIGWDNNAKGSSIITTKDGDNDVIQVYAAGNTGEYIKFAITTGVDLSQADELSYKIRLVSTQAGKEELGFTYAVFVAETSNGTKKLSQANNTSFTVDGVADTSDTGGLKISDGWATITIKNIKARINNPNATTNNKSSIIRNADGTYTIYFLFIARLGGVSSAEKSDFTFQLDDIRVYTTQA